LFILSEQIYCNAAFFALVLVTWEVIWKGMKELRITFQTGPPRIKLSPFSVDHDMNLLVMIVNLFI
jgi:hypothetical protein